MAAIQRAGVPESPVPTILYKYLPPERIDILEGMELRFGRPSEFNDTFDAHYLVPKREGPRGIAARFRLRNQLGVLCLTERPDNHLMWVHYARNHTGFILGLDTSQSFFHENGRILRKVVYRSHPNVLPEADVDACIDACFYKSDAWEHEQEWRCVRQFQSSEPRMVSIEPRLVTQVVFGYRMEDWQKARIVQCVTLLEMTHTQFLASSPSRSSYTFENSPKKMSLCNSCGGNGYLMDAQVQTDPHTHGK